MTPDGQDDVEAVSGRGCPWCLTELCGYGSETSMESTVGPRIRDRPITTAGSQDGWYALSSPSKTKRLNGNTNGCKLLMANRATKWRMIDKNEEWSLVSRVKYVLDSFYAVCSSLHGGEYSMTRNFRSKHEQQGRELVKARENESYYLEFQTAFIFFILLEERNVGWESFDSRSAKD